MVTAERSSGEASSDTLSGGLTRWASGWRDVWTAALIGLAFVPMLCLHASSLWSRPHYQFFPLLIPGAIALVMHSCRRLGPLEPGTARWSVGLAVLGWCLFTASVVFLSTTLAAISALITLLAAIYALGGSKLVWAALPAYAFLWLAVPPPRHLDAELVSRLQSLVSRCSSAMLDAFRVFHMMEGNVVDVAGQRMLVDQACSGIYSLFTLLIGTIFFALWMKASALRTAFLMSAAVVWVLLGNITRIVSIVLLTTRWGIDATKGWKHETIGLVVFAGMLVMLASTDRIYAFTASVGRWLWAAFLGMRKSERYGRDEFSESLVGTSRGTSRRYRSSGTGSPAPAPAASPGPARSAASPTGPETTLPQDTEAELPPPTLLPPPRDTWLGSRLAATAFGLILLPQMLMPGVNWKEVLLANDFYMKAFEKMTADTLPKQVDGGFERVDFRTSHREMDDSWGEHSKSWYYRGGSSIMAVSLDYQFVDYHDLTLCYTGQGWVMQGSQVGVLDESDDIEARSLVTADFVNIEGRRGHLVFGLFDRQGRVITPPQARGLIHTMGSRLRSWFIRSSRGVEAANGLNYQFQVFIESDQPLTKEAREKAFAFFRTARDLVQTASFPAGPEGGPK